MTDLISYLALGISLVSLVVVVMVSRYLPVLRKASAAYVDGSDVVSKIMSELNARASIQDRRLADTQVKLDVLEDRWIRSGWMPIQGPASYPSSGTRSGISPRESAVETTINRTEARLDTGFGLGLSAPVKQRFVRPSRVETSVLKSLLDREMTSPEVRGLLGSSREHAARVMKSLTDKGLVIRETSKKPYVYQISDAGRDMVTNGTASGS